MLCCGLFLLNFSDDGCLFAYWGWPIITGGQSYRFPLDMHAIAALPVLLLCCTIVQGATTRSNWSEHTGVKTISSRFLFCCNCCLATTVFTIALTCISNATQGPLYPTDLTAVVYLHIVILS